jgi:hypothetical protein
MQLLLHVSITSHAVNFHSSKYGSFIQILNEMSEIIRSKYSSMAVIGLFNVALCRYE